MKNSLCDCDSLTVDMFEAHRKYVYDEICDRYPEILQTIKIVCSGDDLLRKYKDIMWDLYYHPVDDVDPNNDNKYWGLYCAEECSSYLMNIIDSHNNFRSKIDKFIRTLSGLADSVILEAREIKKIGGASE